MSNVCPNKPIESGRKKREFNTKEVSELKKRRAEYHARLGIMSPRYRDEQIAKQAAEARSTAQKEDLFASEVGDIIALDPTKYDKLASFFAHQLGWMKKNPLNPSNTYSQAGEVKDALLQSGRVSKRMLEDAGRLHTVKQVKALSDTVDSLIRDKNIPRGDKGIILQELIEVGQIPKLRASYGANSAVDQFQTARYTDWENRMNDYGFTGEEIEMLRNQSLDVSAAFDEMRMVAASVGYKIETLQELGYFPRISTRDFSMRMKEIAQQEGDFARGLRTGGETMSSDWSKVRTTNHFIPESIELAAKFTGVTEDKLLQLLTDPVGWRDFLHKNLTAEQLDDLVDGGVFAKLPMTGREAFTYLTRQYELPYKGLNEMFETDPLKAIDAYANELSDAVANHSMVKTIFKDGIKAGWCVTGNVLELLPAEQKRNFRRLGTMDLSKWYDEDELVGLSNLYVHKVVADQWQSILKISSSPVDLNNTARMWHYLSTNFNKSVLLSSNVLYLGRLFLGAVISTHAGGGDLSKMPQAFFDILRVHHKGLDAFDNVKPYAVVDGKTLTKRELMRKFMLHRGQSIAPQTPGVKVSKLKFEALNPLNVGRAINYGYSYATAFGDNFSGKRAVEYMGSLAQNMLDEAFAPVAAAGNLIDLASKWVMVTSLLERPSAAGVRNAVGKAFSFDTTTFKKFDDVLRHMDDYFYMYDTVGNVTNFVGKYVRPFGIYAMLNPPAQLRHALRSPQKYIAYHRLLQVWNHSQTNSEIPEAGLTEYDHENYPIALDYDPVSGQGMFLFPNNYDPITDAFTFFRETSENVQRSFGMYAGTSEEQRKQAAGEKGWSEWLAKVGQDSYFGDIAALMTGVDPMTGRKRDDQKDNTFLGVPMSPAVEALIGFLPPVSAFNRWNPGGIFGQKEMKDGRGNTVREAKPSVFGYSRTDADTGIYAQEKADPVERVLMSLGARVRVVDVANNMSYTYEDIKHDYNELKGKNLQAQQELWSKRSTMSEQEYASKVSKLEHSIDVETQLGYDMYRVAAWMVQNKVPSKQALRRMNERNIKVDSLPPPGAAFRKKLIIEGLEARERLTGEDYTQQKDMIRNGNN